MAGAGTPGATACFSMLSRNDLIAAAMNTLNQEHGELYAAFVDTVSQHVQEDSLYTFPSPRALPASPSEAELLAYQLLQEGTGLLLAGGETGCESSCLWQGSKGDWE